MWSLKAITVPVVVGAVGMIKVKNHFDKFPGQPQL